MTEMCSLRSSLQQYTFLQAHFSSLRVFWWRELSAWTTLLSILAHRPWHEHSMGFHVGCHQWSHQTASDCVKLKSLRSRAWMIYAFVISHLLKQGVNVFVPSHQSSLQRQRGKDGANALEEKSKVNQAICPGVPLFSSIFLERCNVG